MPNWIFILPLVLLLVVGMLLKRRLVGGERLPAEIDLSWERIAHLYGADDLTGKEVIEKIGGKVGRGYAGVGGDERGLILWHPGHKGARIPWADITLIPGSYMGAPAFRVETAQTADITIVIPRRFEERLIAKAGAAWPGVSEQTVPGQPQS